MIQVTLLLLTSLVVQAIGYTCIRKDISKRTDGLEGTRKIRLGLRYITIGLAIQLFLAVWQVTVFLLFTGELD